MLKKTKVRVKERNRDDQERQIIQRQTTPFQSKICTSKNDIVLEEKDYLIMTNKFKSFETYQHK